MSYILPPGAGAKYRNNHRRKGPRERANSVRDVRPDREKRSGFPAVRKEAPVSVFCELLAPAGHTRCYDIMAVYLGYPAFLTPLISGEPHRTQNLTIELFVAPTEIPAETPKYGTTLPQRVNLLI